MYLVLQEAGEVLCLDGRIFPQTKLVRNIQMVAKVDSVKEAIDCVNKRVDEFFKIYGDEDYAKETGECCDYYYSRYEDDNDIWVLNGLSFNGISFSSSAGALDDRNHYYRFYYIAVTSEFDYLPAHPYKYPESREEGGVK